MVKALNGYNDLACDVCKCLPSVERRVVCILSCVVPIREQTWSPKYGDRGNLFVVFQPTLGFAH